jgi:hypothetical protein
MQMRKLERPSVEWLADASVLAYEYFEVVRIVLERVCLTSGQAYSDLWGHAEAPLLERQLGASLMAALCGLWVEAQIDLLWNNQRNTLHLADADGDSPASLAPLETDLLALIKKLGPCSADAVVSNLPFPSRKRGLDTWFFSGAPTSRDQGRAGWFGSVELFQGHQDLLRALELTKRLATVRAGEATAQQDLHQDALAELETSIVRAIKELP